MKTLMVRGVDMDTYGTTKGAASIRAERLFAALGYSSSRTRRRSSSTYMGRRLRSAIVVAGSMPRWRYRLAMMLPGV